jgi:hypothetical protein
MKRSVSEPLPERHRHLWLLAAAPAIWMAHFLAAYITAALWCARFGGPGGSLGYVRIAIAWYTVLALAGIALVGWTGLRRHRYGGGAPPHDSDTPEDRHRFLGYATSLLAGLSALATALVGLSASFFHVCW